MLSTLNSQPPSFLERFPLTLPSSCLLFLSFQVRAASRRMGGVGEVPLPAEPAGRAQRPRSEPALPPQSGERPGEPGGQPGDHSHHDARPSGVWCRVSVAPVHGANFCDARRGQAGHRGVGEAVPRVEHVAERGCRPGPSGPPNGGAKRRVQVRVRPFARVVRRKAQKSRCPLHLRSLLMV